MDTNIKLRCEQLRDSYRQMRAEGRWPKPLQSPAPADCVQMFANEEARQRHLAQVEDAQKNHNAPF